MQRDELHEKIQINMGKNSQNVIISTDGMRNVMNIIKKKKKERKSCKWLL